MSLQELTRTSLASRPRRPRFIELTPALLKDIHGILEVIQASGSPAFGAFARSPVMVAAKVDAPVARCARQAGIPTARDGFCFRVASPEDCTVALAQLGVLKACMNSLPASIVPRAAPVPIRRVRAVNLDAGFARELLTMLAAIGDARPRSFGAFARAPITVPVRAAPLARFMAGQAGIPTTRTGIVFGIWARGDCEAVLAKLDALRRRLADFQQARGDS